MPEAKKSKDAPYVKQGPTGAAKPVSNELAQINETDTVPVPSKAASEQLSFGFGISEKSTAQSDRGWWETSESKPLLQSLGDHLDSPKTRRCAVRKRI